MFTWRSTPQGVPRQPLGRRRFPADFLPEDGTRGARAAAIDRLRGDARPPHAVPTCRRPLSPATTHQRSQSSRRQWRCSNAHSGTRVQAISRAVRSTRAAPAATSAHAAASVPRTLGSRRGRDARARGTEGAMRMRGAEGRTPARRPDGRTARARRQEGRSDAPAHAAADDRTCRSPAPMPACPAALPAPASSSGCLRRDGGEAALGLCKAVRTRRSLSAIRRSR